MPKTLLVPDENNKILLAYERSEGKKPSRFYIRRCLKWYRIDFKDNDVIKVKSMPENYHFDFDTQPYVII